MSTPAFAAAAAAPGITTSKVGTSSFVSGLAPAAPVARTSTAPTMVVDAFQRKYQSFGKININYSRPKKLASYKRAGTEGAMLDYPDAATFSGHYSISNCNKQSGSAAILAKYDEFCAKGMLMTYKRAAVPTGVYTTKCSEATTPHGAADNKRLFNRTTAFRQAQKPVNVRMNERYTARKHAFVMSHGCSAEESKFAGMPMSCATFLQGNAEAEGACFRNVLPQNTGEDYMASGIRAQIIAAKMPGGVYPLGYCMDGYRKGDADERRVAAGASEFRATQASAFSTTHSSYEARRMAIKLYGHGCNHEEEQFSAMPAVSAAMVRY